jgi:hypothetical protein
MKKAVRATEINVRTCDKADLPTQIVKRPPGLYFHRNGKIRMSHADNQRGEVIVSAIVSMPGASGLSPPSA